MKQLPLANSRECALIDESDHSLVSRFAWHRIQRRNKIYAIGRDPVTKRRIYLHRLIMGEPIRKLVDHINGNGLDCRRSNLRICTRSENMANCKPHRDRKGKYKGVYQHKKRYVAQICVRGARMKVGSFETAIEAAKAYDTAARVMFGQFALTNFKL